MSCGTTRTARARPISLRISDISEAPAKLSTVIRALSTRLCWSSARAVRASGNSDAAITIAIAIAPRAVRVGVARGRRVMSTFLAFSARWCNLRSAPPPAPRAGASGSRPGARRARLSASACIAAGRGGGPARARGHVADVRWVAVGVAGAGRLARGGPAGEGTARRGRGSEAGSHAVAGAGGRRGPHTASRGRAGRAARDLAAGARTVAAAVVATGRDGHGGALIQGILAGGNHRARPGAPREVARAAGPRAGRRAAHALLAERRRALGSSAAGGARRLEATSAVGADVPGRAVGVAGTRRLTSGGPAGEGAARRGRGREAGTHPVTGPGRRGGPHAAGGGRARRAARNLAAGARTVAAAVVATEGDGHGGALIQG